MKKKHGGFETFSQKAAFSPPVPGDSKSPVFLNFLPFFVAGKKMARILLYDGQGGIYDSYPKSVPIWKSFLALWPIFMVLHWGRQHKRKFIKEQEKAL